MGSLSLGCFATQSLTCSTVTWYFSSTSLTSLPACILASYSFGIRVHDHCFYSGGTQVKPIIMLDGLLLDAESPVCGAQISSWLSDFTIEASCVSVSDCFPTEANGASARRAGPISRRVGASACRPGQRNLGLDKDASHGEIEHISR